MSAPDCLFCKLVAGDVASERLMENEQVLVIRDIQPRAPVHLLLIPKEHIADARELTVEHGPLLGRLFVAAGQAAHLERVDGDGYRLAFNVGEAAGMTVPHLHLHLLGGRRLGPEG